MGMGLEWAVHCHRRRFLRNLFSIFRLSGNYVGGNLRLSFSLYSLSEVIRKLSNRKRINLTTRFHLVSNGVITLECRLIWFDIIDTLRPRAFHGSMPVK